MIPTSLPWLFTIYLLVFLAPVFALWIAFEMARQSRERQALRGLTRCAICGLRYPSKPTAAPRACPRCGTLNEHHELTFI
jgi:rubrerythrin